NDDAHFHGIDRPLEIERQLAAVLYGGQQFVLLDVDPLLRLRRCLRQRGQRTRNSCKIVADTPIADKISRGVEARKARRRNPAAGLAAALQFVDEVPERPTCLQIVQMRRNGTAAISARVRKIRPGPHKALARGSARYSLKRCGNPKKTAPPHGFPNPSP